MDVGGRCPAIPGFCVEACKCENCGRLIGCAKAKYNALHPNRNRKCFRCKYLKPVTMGVECDIKKDR